VAIDDLQHLSSAYEAGPRKIHPIYQTSTGMAAVSSWWRRLPLLQFSSSPKASYSLVNEVDVSEQELGFSEPDSQTSAEVGERSPLLLGRQHFNNNTYVLTYVLDPPTTEHVFTDIRVSDGARSHFGDVFVPRPIERIDFASSTTRLMYRAPREIIEAIRIVPRLALVLSLTLKFWILVGLLVVFSLVVTRE
jgi:hypothetical protein